MKRYDLIVIGGGSAGLTAAIIAARVRARVLLVDKEALGGDCLHTGCVPSKALIASARLAQQMRRAAEYGLAPVEVRADVAAVMARIRSIKSEIGRHDSPETLRALGAEVAFGGARFVDAHTIELGGGERVFGERLLIATGSRAAMPPVPGLAELTPLDHTTVFSLTTLPRRIAVLGGGPIGCELGQALQRLGAQVTILQRGRQLLPREEPDVAACLAEALRADGVDVRLGTAATGCARDGAEKIVRFAGGELRVDELLVAAGRRANVASLDLAAAGVRTGERGILVDDWLRTSQPHIFAAGDCTGGPQFTHWAEYEARVATRNALFRGHERRSLAIVPWVTFTDPEVARVGPTLDEARRKEPAAHAHRFEFARLDRALTEGEPRGFIRVVVDKHERVLGAHLIGLHAGEALTEWVSAVERRAKLDTLSRTIHAYPTASRINRRVADLPFLEHGLPDWALRLGARFTPR